MDNITKIINKIYEKSGFLETYGGSFYMTILILITFFIIITYFYILNHANPIKEDWTNQRCKPYIIPFAGIINKPENMSATEFTSENFTYCVQNILVDIVGVFLAPIYYFVNTSSFSLSGLTSSVQDIRKVISNMRENAAKVTKDIMNKILNVIISLQNIIIKIKDMLGKTQGILTANIMTLLGTYYAIESTIKSIVAIIIMILLALTGIIIPLLTAPFGLGLPVAIPLIATFIAIAVPGILVYTIQVMVLKQHSAGFPSIPSCFGGETVVELENGKLKLFKDLEPGMVLKNNNVITSKMKMACLDEVYQLGNIIVTGNHHVKFNNKFIKVKNHYESILIDKNIDFVYCINTSKKIIDLDNYTFYDYDELTKDEIEELNINCSKYLPKQFDLENFHNYLDGGFIPSTQIELLDGHSIPISNIEVNDVLKFGERVLGIVKIKSNQIELKEYIFENNLILKGGPNLQICDSDLGIISTLDCYGEKIKSKYIYHLITDKRTFMVNGIKLYDYNSCLDKYLSDKNISLIKALL